MTKLWWVFPALVQIGLFILVPASALAGKNSDTIDLRIQQEKAGLKRLKARIEKQEKALFMAKGKKKSLLKALDQIDNRLQYKEKELKVTQWDIKQNQKKVEKLESSIVRVERQLADQNQVLRQRLRSMYKGGHLLPLKVIFSSENFNDMLLRMKTMENLAAHDAVLFRGYGQQLSQLKAEVGTLLSARTRLVALERETIQKKKDIRRQKTGKSRFLKNLKEEEALSQQMREELVLASKNLNKLLASLHKKQNRSEGLQIAQRKGKLNPPVPGKYLNKFGRKRDKQYQSYIVYNGVNIKSTKGSPVRAVFEGRVLYAGPLEGYGNLIIVGHGKDFHSLYGHLDSIITQVGKTIRTDQIIAKSGDTGSLVGESLYFELRHKGEPIEPTKWFRVAKR